MTLFVKFMTEFLWQAMLYKILHAKKPQEEQDKQLPEEVMDCNQ